MKDNRPIEPRISVDESREVLGELARAAPAKPPDNNRRMRVPYTSRKIVIELEEGAGRKVGFTVQGRNLSKRGVAVLHAQYVHTGKACVVTLPRLNGTMVSIPGTVRRCRFVRGRTHEIAVAFDRDIDIADFIQLDGVQRRSYVAETTQDQPAAAPSAPTALGAKLLVIDDFDASRDLYALWLKKGGYAPLTAAKLADAKQVLAAHRVDAVILNPCDTTTSATALRELRAIVGATPIICISNEETDSPAARQMSAGFDDLLCKPFTADDMLLSLKAALSGDPYSPSNQTPIRSTLQADADVLPALQKFADQARTLADMLRATLENQQPTETARLCKRLADSGTSFGFQAVTDVGRQALGVLQKNGTPSAVRREIDRVIGVLNRIEV